MRFAAIRSPTNSFPRLTLDFGREVDGRVQIVSDTDAPAIVSIAYGESLGRTELTSPISAPNSCTSSPNGSGVGPKSAFRYARIRFLSGPAAAAFQLHPP